jgi:hypothetical protein
MLRSATNNNIQSSAPGILTNVGTNNNNNSNGGTPPKLNTNQPASSPINGGLPTTTTTSSAIGAAVSLASSGVHSSPIMDGVKSTSSSDSNSGGSGDGELRVSHLGGNDGSDSGTPTPSTPIASTAAPSITTAIPSAATTTMTVTTPSGGTGMPLVPLTIVTSHGSHVRKSSGIGLQSKRPSGPTGMSLGLSMATTPTSSSMGTTTTTNNGNSNTNGGNNTMMLERDGKYGLPTAEELGLDDVSC